MKSLRMLVLIVAVGAWSPFLMQAHAQQEVDPDHFEQPAAAQANANTAKAQANHQVNHQASKHMKTASKHTGRKSNHRQVQA